jgi:hypothetical protein
MQPPDPADGLAILMNDLTGAAAQLLVHALNAQPEQMRKRVAEAHFAGAVPEFRIRALAEGVPMDVRLLLVFPTGQVLELMRAGGDDAGTAH